MSTKSRPELAILVPVLNRPHRVEPVLRSIRETTPEARVLFIADPDDDSELDALDAADAEFISPGGSYACKINDGVEQTTAPLLFLGADDLQPTMGWFERAFRHISNTVSVVGVNDLLERPHRPQHATHFLCTRKYAEQPTIDGGRGPLHEGYRAWGCDDELIATATRRNTYIYASDAHVRHLHPMADPALDDAVYRLGREHARRDLRILRGRRQLWMT